MARLTVEQIAAHAAVTEEEVEIDEWGGSVVIRSLTREECLDFAELKAEDAEVQAIVRGMVDPAFTDAEARELLKGKAGVGIKLSRLILERSGLGATFRP
jgi:hypothetical protein